MAALKESALTLLSDTAGGISTIADMSGATARTVYTVPVGKTCVLSHAYLEADGDVGANLEVTIGQVGALTDFVGTTNGDNLDADGDVILVAPVPSATPATTKAYAAGTVIQIDIAVAGAAVTGSLYLFGILY